MFPPISPARTLTADVANQIERMIRDGKLLPGQRLPPEHELIESMNISRTVLREAVAALRAQGLLTSRRGAGVFVSSLPPQPTFRIRAEDMSAVPRMLALLEFRAGIEVECAGLAAQRRTDEHLQAMKAARLSMKSDMRAGRSGVESDLAFHMSIAEAAQNFYFPDFLVYLNDVAMIPRAQLHEQSTDEVNPDYARIINDVHLAIENAIAARDPNAAREAMRLHFMIGAQHYRSGISES